MFLKSNIMFFQFYFWEQSKIQPRGQTFCIKNISLAFEDLFCWGG
jgi:hypothetical protein